MTALTAEPRREIEMGGRGTGPDRRSGDADDLRPVINAPTASSALGIARG